jgi:hypothetical protein
VNCSASDAHGKPASSTFDVSVVDTTPPQISGVSPDLVIECDLRCRRHRHLHVAFGGSIWSMAPWQ